MLHDELTIKITPTSATRINSVDWDNLPFGRVFSDHMLVMDFKDGEWQQPQIMPFGSLDLHPATSALHYGQSIFEGMKAEKDKDGNILIFRPDLNAKRFFESCERMCMPTLSESTFVELIKRTVEIDRSWVPSKEDTALYIRPFMFATDDFIGIRPSETYKFVIFTCPVGAYYPDPVKVKIEEHYTRASEGGVGRAKTAGNYAASLYPAKLGRDIGFDQLLWTDAKEHKYIEESGTMNIVFEIDGVIVTPSEDSDTILRGIIKRSVVEVAQSWGVPVEERQISVEELVKALREGRVNDAFGAGTAATLAPITHIGFRDELFELPDLKTRGTSLKIAAYLKDLKAGKVEDEFGWMLKF